MRQIYCICVCSPHFIWFLYCNYMDEPHCRALSLQYSLSLTKSLISCIITCIIIVPTILLFQEDCFCLFGITCLSFFRHTQGCTSVLFGLGLDPKPKPQPVTSLCTIALNRTRTSDIHFCCIRTGFQCPRGL